MPAVSQIEVPQPFTAVTATAAAATAVSATIPAAGAAQRALRFVAVSVSGAASPAVTLTVSDGATPVLKLDLALTVGVPYILALGDGIAGSPGNAMTVALSATATSSIGKLTIGYDAY